MTALYYPLFTLLDLYKIGFLITIAVVSTIPWDSYLIRTGVWSYPADVIIGPTLYDIPLEEVFFFVIQTFNTTLLYLLASKPVLKEIYLVKESKDNRATGRWRYTKIAGQLFIGLGIRNAWHWVQANDARTYLGLILIWALPFILLLWSLAYQLIIGLPWTTTVLPIAAPTVYLWVVDTLALRRGTWVISAGTKTGWELWPSLEIEEAIFFLLTNVLIVFGLVAFDNAVAILNAFPAHFPHVPSLPSPVLLVQALLTPSSTYDDDRILAYQQAVQRLSKKSRSFYMASGAFSGRLRIDLILLYSFCRVADDLIDNASSPTEARQWLAKLQRFLQLSYGGATTNAKGDAIAAMDTNRGAATLFIVQNFPPETQLSLLLLPTRYLDREPLDELLRGFEMDLVFSTPPVAGNKKTRDPRPPTTPITSLATLDLYGARVAGTVALLCIQLVLHHHPDSARVTPALARRLLAAGHDMGIALQYTNIARDLAVDARLGRCYVPPEWLRDVGVQDAHAAVAALGAPREEGEKEVQEVVRPLRQRLLERAFAFYARSLPAIELLPGPARGPMRAAVESYMQIARELRKSKPAVKHGRATVPLYRRVLVAWRAMCGPRKVGKDVLEG